MIMPLLGIVKALSTKLNLISSYIIF